MIQRHIQASVLALIVAIPVAIAQPGTTDFVPPAEGILPLDEFAAINAIKSAGYYPEPLEPNEAWRDSHL